MQKKPVDKPLDYDNGSVVESNRRLNNLLLTITKEDETNDDK
jgi:hypothetical protein